ncbi:putative NADPH-dependent methylglyoxal reductase Grp2p [[Candida] jaroonii]|uniref:NADPH-dependent methylglyoxal reductase Grp2p n=1 Tax=[Candida] jaroonii TaxID=467808 RepID=A0ACA9YF33_9ASCO|nr:putative NADPH-dependent methylglyoxal reductase Grp2p [[Candida] jaroonii]
MSKSVLITGANSYAGIYAIIKFVNEGYQVRTTMRDSSKFEETRTMVKKTGELTDQQASAIEFMEGDLGSEDGWDKAVEGIDYVVHVAYPFINGVPLEKLYKPAVEGSLHLLNLSIQSPTVKHFVFCSSFATVGFNDEWEDGPEHVITEEDWTKLDSPMTDGYMQSKIICEKKMFELVRSDENLKSPYPITFNAINPYGIVGPVPVGFDRLNGLSAILKSALSGEAEAILDLYFNTTDVRDLAASFVKAIEDPKTYDQRFLLVHPEEVNMPYVIDLYKKTFPKHLTDKYPSKYTDVWFGSRNVSIDKATKLLDYKPVPNDETLIALGKGLYDLLGYKY